MEGFESPEGYGAPITLDDVTEAHMMDTYTKRRKYTNTAILTYEVCVRGKTRRIRREASPKEARKGSHTGIQRHAAHGISRSSSCE